MIHRFLLLGLGTKDFLYKIYLLAEVLINSKLQKKLNWSSQVVGLFINNTNNHRNRKNILNLLNC